MQEIFETDEFLRLWILFLRVRDTIHKARERELRQAGIPSTDIAVLFYVQVLGDRATPAEMSRWLYREPHSVSTLISKMEKKGLVRKVKDLERKNMVRVEITEKGQETYRLSGKGTIVHHIISSLSEEERHQLSSILETLHDRALEELGIKESKPPWP